MDPLPGRIRCQNPGRTRSLRDTNGVVLLRESRMTSGPENIEQSPEQSTPSHPLGTALQQAHPEWIAEVIYAFGETTIVVPREHIAAACAFLKTWPEGLFNFLADICGADRGVEEEPRFEVNYHLFSTTKFHRIRL